MSLKNLQRLTKIVGKAGKTVHKSIKTSLGFMDDILEKEYIVNSIDDIKEATGKVVEKTGEIYENTRLTIEEMRDNLESAEEE